MTHECANTTRLYISQTHNLAWDAENPSLSWRVSGLAGAEHNPDAVPSSLGYQAGTLEILSSAHM